MTWYDKNWRYRFPFTITNDGGANSVDATLTVPEDFSKFWDNVQSDLDDVVVTAADGRRVLDYDINGLNYGNKAATIRVDGYSWANESWGGNGGALVANRSVCGFVYYGNATANNSLHSGNVSVSSAKAMHVELIRPRASAVPYIKCARVRPGQTLPTQKIAKQSSETTRCFWDLRNVMLLRNREYNGSRFFEEIAWIDVYINDSQGNSKVSTMLTPSSVSMLHPFIIQHELKGGDNAQKYLLTLTVGTDDGAGGTRVLEFNANLAVDDIVADTA